MTLSVQRLEGVDVALDDAWLERVASAVLEAASQAQGASAGAPPASPTASWPWAAARGVEADLLLADDAALHGLNRRFRGVDYPTDVLAFAQLDGAAPAFAGPAVDPLHLGDVAISAERAQAQAQAYGHSLERELGYLLAHGLLHLLGYDHEADDQQAAMRRVEEAALAAAGLPRAPA